ncbi:MAG TPA: DUF2064 domain-containing protein [Saprospiraceae bacterium]|nr:DUF2064 domain-containing protein [Saprospiraceae bacterium]
MTSAAENTALLLFTRSAPAEARIKALLPKHREARQLAAAMNQGACQLAQATRLSLFIVDETTQAGSDFSSRFRSAFTQVFSQGFDRVIAIGNDCPELTIDLIRRAQLQLQSVDMVLGPSHDGGVYLMGLSQCGFNKLDFDALPWQTGQLFARLLEVSSDWNRHYALPYLHDIDSFEELHHLFLSRLLPNWFHQILTCFLAENIPDCPSAFAKKSRADTFQKQLRAPPVACFR